MKPILLAPAMNTAMWDHPITKKQLGYICSMGSEQPLTKNEPNTYEDDDSALHSNIVRVIPPQVKKLACGDHGNGALADLSDILTITKDCLNRCGFHNDIFKDV
jgi:phosphopantothenoylcysteine decarboxylase